MAFVYVFENEVVGRVKVGYTTMQVETRLSAMNGGYCVGAWELRARWPLPEKRAIEVERLALRILRVHWEDTESKNSEFFICDVGTAMDAVGSAIRGEEPDQLASDF